MARPEKDGQHISLYMEKAVAEALTKYCKRTMLSKTAAIEKAVKEMIEREGKNNE